MAPQSLFEFLDADPLPRPIGIGYCSAEMSNDRPMQGPAELVVPPLPLLPCARLVCLAPVASHRPNRVGLCRLGRSSKSVHGAAPCCRVG